jgi:hypothetical protein
MPKEQTWALLADLHNGATTGLTLNPVNLVQHAVLDRWKDALNWFGEEPDVVLVNGDGWDGPDPKSNDVTEASVTKQARGCADIIVMLKPKKEVILITGTPYHVEHKGQTFDLVVSDRIKLKMLEKYGRKIKVTIRRKITTTINGWFTLEARHSIGGSSIPHGRATSALRSQAWAVLNSALAAREAQEAPAWPDLMVFAHRHYYMASENAWGDVLILPCWSALGGKYGDEMCDGHVDLGLCKLIVGATKENGWKREKKLYQAGVVQRTESR